MNKMLETFDKALSCFEKILIGISIGIVNFTMIITTVDITMRYIFNKPLVGVYELAELSMIGMVFLGVGCVQSEKGHISITILVDKLSTQTQIISSIFGNLVGIFAMTIITLSSAKATLAAFYNSEATMGIVNIPIWPAKAIVPLGIGVLTFRIIVDVIKDLRKLKTA